MPVHSTTDWKDTMFSKLRITALSALAVTLVFAACENADQLTSTSLKQKVGNERVVVTEYGENGYKLVKETDPEVGTVSAVIDQNGGSLSIGGTTLAIPAGAVSAATTFTINRPNGELTYDFTATQNTANDVGSAGFAVPLSLTISYADVHGAVKDPVIVWIKANGYAEPQPTTVDNGAKTMTAPISHFSVYGGADTLVPCNPDFDPDCEG
jgi:hypothetical protein